MARNFRISISHRGSQSVHLRLAGDFDGSSAYGLIDIIKENIKANKRIIIDTDGLRNVNAFGVVVLSKFKTPKRSHLADIRFTGAHSPIFSA